MVVVFIYVGGVMYLWVCNGQCGVVVGWIMLVIVCLVGGEFGVQCGQFGGLYVEYYYVLWFVGLFVLVDDCIYVDGVGIGIVICCLVFWVDVGDCLCWCVVVVCIVG